MAERFYRSLAEAVSDQMKEFDKEFPNASEEERLDHFMYLHGYGEAPEKKRPEEK